MFSFVPLRSLIAVSLVAAAVTACSSPPYPVTKTCDSIAEACHEFDHGTEGPAHDCHLAAHTGDEAVCVQKLSTCMVVCTKTDAGGIDAAGASSVGTPDGGPGVDGAGSDVVMTAEVGAADLGAADVGTAETGPADDGACVAYCACLTKQCSQPADAPAWVKDQKTCVATCATFSAQQRSCWSSFCDVNAATVPAHNCVHAWGGHGVDECP